MSIQVGATETGAFVIRDEQLQPVTVTPPPTVTLLLNGLQSSTTVSVNNTGTGTYTYSFVVPSSAGQTATLSISATLPSTATVSETILLGVIQQGSSGSISAPSSSDTQVTDRLVQVLEQGRILTRGVACRGNHPLIYLDENEKLGLNIDWSTWLGSDTILGVENETTTLTVENATHDDSKTFMLLSGDYSGYVEHRITTAAGQVKELTILADIKHRPMRERYDYRYYP